MTTLGLALGHKVSAQVKTGDIYQLGRHRLMCGDATSKEDVAKLFDGRQPTLVVTSPPYAKQRDYDRHIKCWDSMMLGALNGHNFASNVQLLINLGVIHHKGELNLYWLPFIYEMQAVKWQFAGMYPWDKLNAIPGACTGTPRPSHEFIFHLRKDRVYLNKNVPNKYAGTMNHGFNLRGKNNEIKKRGSPSTAIHKCRTADSVWRLHPDKANHTGHPAVYPVNLPKRLISAWKKQECVVYDPFCGSGTTLHAAEVEGVDGLGMEISEAYCQIAIDRWNKAFPAQPARKI